MTSPTAFDLLPPARQRTLRSARIAITATMVAFGGLFAAWAPRIPLVRDKLGISDGVLGLTLLGSAVGSLIGMPLAGYLCARFGARRVMVIALSMYAVFPVALAFVPNAAMWFAVLLVWGVGSGVVEVSANIIAADIEREYGRPIMSTIHGGWSLGALAGAAAGAILAHFDTPLFWHLAGAGAVVLICLAIIAPFLPETVAHDGPSFALPSRALLVIGTIMFCSYFAEGAVADWSAIYMRDALGATAGLAGTAYVVYGIVMTTGRLGSERVLLRFGAPRIVQVGAAVGGAACLAGLLIGQAWAAIIGIGLLGLGLCVVVPVAVSAAAAREPGREPAAIAAATTCGFAGFLLGPPTIGGVSEATNITVAMGLIVVLTILIAVLSPALGSPRHKSSDPIPSKPLELVD